jgi:AcrR family transcriptional regulator
LRWTPFPPSKPRAEAESMSDLFNEGAERARPRTIDDDAVLDAADRIVERGGPAAVTFASVAAEVGLAPATLVQRIGTKRGLLLATTIRGWQSIVNTLSRERDARESPLEALR